MKTEMKVIVALFVVGYEFDIVDSTGNFPKTRVPRHPSGMRGTHLFRFPDFHRF
jgi:hypothetical protein